MAVPFLNNIDLNNNQILNVRLQNLSTNPTGAGAAAGSIYYNSGAGVNRPAWSDGTSWHQIYPAATTALTSTVVLRDSFGNATANAFIGALQGNADTSTKLLTARTIGISGGKLTATAASFDGSANVNINVTGLSVVAGEIALTSGWFIVGGATNTGEATAKALIPISGFGNAAADVNFGGFKATNLAGPVNASDAATKGYVDSAAVGLSVKEAAKYATKVALPSYNYASLTITATANGPLVVDGIQPAATDRILVKNESGTNTKRNGIYTVSQSGSASTPFILVRSSDFDSSFEASPGSFVFVTNGDTLAQTGWVMSAPGPITLDTSDIIWSQFSGTGEINAGDGLTKSGNTINAVGTTNRITVNADSIDIASTYAGQTTITTLGTITQGTWQGATIAVNQGGTGLTTYNTGSLLYAGGSTVISQLAPVAVGSVLLSGGVSPALPSWGKVGLTTHVTGTLPVGNGGTGASTLTANGVLIGNGTAAVSSYVASAEAQILVSAATSLAPTWRAMSGDATLSQDGILTIANNAIGFTKLAQVSGLSVIGNSTATQSTASAITAALDHQVLRRSGSTIGFGAINLANSNAVTGILPSANGGTGSAFFQAVGASALRTYTFNNFSSFVPAFFAATIAGNGTATQFSVSHNFGSRDVSAYVYQAASPYAQVFVDVEAVTLNSVQLTFASSVPVGTSYRVVIVGFGPDPGGA